MSRVLPSFHGFTKNESTGQYLLVIGYHVNGDLRANLRLKQTTWKEKIEMAYFIGTSINYIHEAEIIHR